MTSLADLQAERDKLRALDAKDEFEAALAETCAHAELQAAALAVRRVLLAALEGLPARLAQAVAGERDETRAHYLMSDAAHDLLSAIGHEVEAASAPLPVVGERFRRGAKPRDLLTVSQWADRHRWLRSGTNAPGRWSTALTPYLREIMDSLSEHSPVRSVVFIKSSGVGGTEALYNWLGYVMHHLANKDMLVVVPTLELRDRAFNPRLAKMLDESEALAGLVTTAARNRANRGDLLEYGARALIIKAGANSPDSLRSDHLPYVICDEVDAFPWDVGGEGDPMTLIENRQRTFSRAKTYYVSTPTLEGASRIDQLYNRSDRRRYHLPCPHCGEMQPLEWGHLKYRTAAVDHNLPEAERIPQVESAWYVCRECGAEIEEGHKAAMLAGGQWVAERPHIRHTRGYHLNALYAPIGLGLSWAKVAQKWLTSQGDTAERKAFVNTFLGEVWRESGDSRDTAGPDVWADLERELREADVEFAPIDAGYNTSMVKAFCEGKRWALPVKGIPGAGRELIEDPKKRRQRMRTRAKRGTPIEPLGVDQGKALLYARLKQSKPGPGYIHFLQAPAFDDEYFAQLAAEKLVTKVKGTRPFHEWIKTRPRNEALDCLVYALAAVRLSGRDLSRPRPPGPAPAATGISLATWARR